MELPWVYLPSFVWFHLYCLRSSGAWLIFIVVDATVEKLFITTLLRSRLMLHLSFLPSIWDYLIPSSRLENFWTSPPPPQHGRRLGGRMELAVSWFILRGTASTAEPLLTSPSWAVPKFQLVPLASSFEALEMILSATFSQLAKAPRSKAAFRLSSLDSQPVLALWCFSGFWSISPSF